MRRNDKWYIVLVWFDYLKKPVKVQDVLAAWSEDPIKRAIPLSVEDDLPRLNQACFHSKIFKRHKKRVQVWTKLLVAIALIGWKSDICGRFCPQLEHVELPWDQSTFWYNSTPKFIVFSFCQWKYKPKWFKLAGGNEYYKV
jgi:hypothetical protein